MITLEELYQNEIKQEQVILPLRNAGNEDSMLGFLWSKNLVFGTWELSQKNFAAAKNYFYNCGRIDTMRVLKYNARLFDYSIKNVCVMLLSDSPELMHQYATLRYQGDGKNYPDMDEMVADGELPIFCHTIFMLMQDNAQLLVRNLSLMETVTFARYPAYRPMMHFDGRLFKAIYEKNVGAAEAALAALLNPEVHIARTDDGIIDQYLSFPAAGYAKLARLKEVPVTIQHPLVPEELLTTDPLPAYTDRYDFVKAYLG